MDPAHAWQAREWLAHLSRPQLRYDSPLVMCSLVARHLPRLIPVLTVLLLACASHAAGQSAAADAASTLRVQAPELPEVMARDDQGHATMRAVRLTGPLKVDGRLDEAIYSTVRGATDFTQLEPVPWTRATEQTVVWLFYDDDAIYFAARCLDSQPGRSLATDMRRDSAGVVGGDYVGFILDTLHDRRSGVLINVSPIGGRRDGLVTEEKNFNVDWNGVFQSATAQFEQGWAAEIRIPFRTLRYRQGENQVWGFNVHRVTRWKNEKSFLMPMKGLTAGGALMRLSMAADVVGIEVPPPGKNIEIKPYAVSTLTDVARPQASTSTNGDVGVDAKIGVAEGLTADLTYNTDFAQVEADEQQINLTRFSLFFPEKREFFIENAGLFAFANATGSGSLTPLLFYSRRIGLDGNRIVPLQAGGRLSGRAGHFTLGALGIRTEAANGAPATTFSVLRMQRDIFKRSSLGAIVTNRSHTQTGPGSNQAYGADTALAFFTNLTASAYWAQTRTGGNTSGATSYRAQTLYDSDRYGFQAERLYIGERFNPQVGFVSRPNMQRNFLEARFSPRPKGRFVRKYWLTANYDRIASAAGRLESRTAHADFETEYHSGDRLGLYYDRRYEFLPAPFRVATGVTLPVGGYPFDNVRASYGFGQQRVVAGTVFAERGSFYSGDKTTVGVSGGRLAISSLLSVSPSVTVNHVTLPEGTFTNKLVAARVVFTATPLMFTSALIQYNSASNSLSANVRFRWEYQPGSEMFIVYNEDRDPRLGGFPALLNRGIIFKINRLFRF